MSKRFTVITDDNGDQVLYQNSALGGAISNDGSQAGATLNLSEQGRPDQSKIVNNATGITGQINFTWSALLNAGLGVRTVRLFPKGTNVRYVVNPEDPVQGASQLANIADTSATVPVASPVAYKVAHEAAVNKTDGLIVSDEPIELVCAIVEGGTLTSLFAEAS